MVEDSNFPSPRYRAPLLIGEVKFVASEENAVFSPLLWREVERSEGEGKFDLKRVCQ